MWLPRPGQAICRSTFSSKLHRAIQCFHSENHRDRGMVINSMCLKRWEGASVNSKGERFKNICLLPHVNVWRTIHLGGTLCSHNTVGRNLVQIPKSLLLQFKFITLSSMSYSLTCASAQPSALLSYPSPAITSVTMPGHGGRRDTAFYRCQPENTAIHSNKHATYPCVSLPVYTHVLSLWLYWTLMVKEWEYYFLHLFSTKVVKFAPKPPPHRYYSNTKIH